MEELRIRRPAIFQNFKNLSAGESTRHGGVSPKPYGSLNLGKSTGDAPENLLENRRRFAAALGFSPENLAWSHQVHEDKILKVEAPGGSTGFDALMTNVPGILLSVSTADCVPMLVFDAKNWAVAAIHAGWRGTVARIAEKTLQAMTDAYGTRPSDCFAYVGTCICAATFEVGEEVAEHFSGGEKRFDAERQKHFVDLKKANAAQLGRSGIAPDRIETSPFSTVLNNDDYFSHRLENGVTGRMLTAIGVRRFGPDSNIFH